MGHHRTQHGGRGRLVPVEVRPLTDAERPWLGDLIAREWGLPVVSISGLLEPLSLPGFVVADDDGALVGAVTYRLDDAGECEVATLNARREGEGIGRALMAAVKEVADRDGRRVWLITTNDNLRAIGFYQHIGMDLRALHRDFVDEVRRHKPDVDSHSANGIEFRHALELSF
jgi:ribosomal protein S18 acetylase RimI-like enzyme